LFDEAINTRMQSVSFCNFSVAKFNNLEISYSPQAFITEFITLPLQCEQHSALASVYMEYEFTLWRR
jgi:hypothetical protein